MTNKRVLLAACIMFPVRTHIFHAFAIIGRTVSFYLYQSIEQYLNPGPATTAATRNENSFIGMKAVTDSDLLTIGYRYAYALAANRQDAEDLLHDAWIRLVSRYGDSPDKPLLFRTIKNLFIDRVRHNTIVSNYASSQLEPLHNQDVALDSLVNADLLEHHLDKLKSNEREVLFLSVVEGYTADEISAMTGQVRGTILSLLFRTKKKLRNSMVADAQDGADMTSENGSVRADSGPEGKARSNVIKMKSRRVS